MDELDLRYLFVMEYLARKELDLHQPRSSLSHFQEQCIIFVSGQRHKLRDEMRGGADLDDDSMSHRLDADPSEMDVSDQDLINLAAKAKRR